MLLEKHADVIIADHARKDAPHGSVSWKYVADSIKAGELCIIDKYRIGHAAVPRPVGSTQHVKATRTPFTAEDDRRLIKWVLEQERRGERSSGNKIYQEFAEQVNPP